VLDIMIPHPDGIEVCNQLRRNGWRGPIIAVSALTTPDTQAHVRRAGADLFLPKPFHLAELIDALDTLLGTDQSLRTPVVDQRGAVVEHS
jgi:DNA-binding response OmpR family regulator